MHGRNLTIGLIAALLVVWAPAFGQATQVKKLSLSDCRSMALENNLDLVSAKQDPAIAEQQIGVAEAPFDAVFSAGATYDDQKSDQDITVSGLGTAPAENDADFINADLRFDHLLKYGGSYTFRYDYFDTDRFGTQVQAGTNIVSTSSEAQSVNSLTLEYAMPLLQGFGKEVNTEQVLLAQGNLEISKEDLRLAAIRTVQLVEDAYWDLLGTREALRISRMALERAEDLLELNRKKVEVGTLAPIEITQAEAGVASQVEAVIVAENALENAEDILLQLLAIPEDDPLWSQSLDLTDRPSFEPVEIDLDAAIAEALAARPEMESARQVVRNTELSERVAKRQVRHGLDLTARLTPGNSDFDQDSVIITPPASSSTNVASDFTNWQVGLRYRIPLHNRQAKSNYAIAQLQRSQSDYSLKSTHQQVYVDVRTAARNLKSGVQRVEAARTNVVLQEKKLDAEQKKFENGMSTSFEVLTFQNDLADAQLSEIRARLDHAKALTELEQAKGTLLTSRGLSLVP